MNYYTSRIVRNLILIFLSSFSLALLFLSFSTHASGVRPETSTLIIDSGKGGGSINVRNTEKHPVLLYTKVMNVPDDKGPELVVTQPVVRLEPGQVQRVRFILTNGVGITKEHYKRVSFEGISPSKGDDASLAMTIRQNIPVIIAPAGSEGRQKVWEDLRWGLIGNILSVKNPGNQVVRLDPNVRISSTRESASLPKSYILPGEQLSVALKKQPPSGSTVKIEPVSRYGYAAGAVEQKIN